MLNAIARGHFARDPGDHPACPIYLSQGDEKLSLGRSNAGFRTRISWNSDERVLNLPHRFFPSKLTYRAKEEPSSLARTFLVFALSSHPPEGLEKNYPVRLRNERIRFPPSRERGSFLTSFYQNSRLFYLTTIKIGRVRIVQFEHQTCFTQAALVRCSLTCG